jgi:hypothetical protein
MQNPFLARQPALPQAPTFQGRGAMAVPTMGGAPHGARMLSPRAGMGPPGRAAAPAPPPQDDIFSSFTPGAEQLLQPLANVQTDAESLRALTSQIQGLAPDVAQIWKQGVEMLLQQPAGPRDVMQKLQTYFGLQPLTVDLCAKMLNMRRVELSTHEPTERRNRMIAVAGLGLYGRAQAQAILRTETSDQKVYRNCTQRLRDDMSKGGMHAQLVLSFMRTDRGPGARV